MENVIMNMTQSLCVVISVIVSSVYYMKGGGRKLL